ncbi:2-oxo acid dehydrogenase subunit E2 [Microbacterium sp. 179-I 3D2 NHS]|uniref:2-oxo acid dehydrogenase subunit E2 n=1 Tax=Microbacterium sp. 179-I 3D2 NHS TaxID=3235178 RepID=UPI0039A2F797
MPALGMASDSVYLAEWLKQPGDRIEVGDVIANIETDKAELEVESTFAGVLGRHRFPADSEVPSGATIAVVLQEGETDDGGNEGSDAVAGARAADEAGAREEAADAGLAPLPSASEPTRSEEERTPEEATLATRDADPARTISSPAASALQREERGRDEATGELRSYALSPRERRRRSGVLGEADRDGAASISRPSTADVPVVTAMVANERRTSVDAATRYRAAVSTAVSRSWAEIPHFSVQRELRVRPLIEVQQMMRALNSNVSLTDVLIKAYAMSLMERFGTRTIDLGLAVATERGVSIPVLRDVALADVLRISELRRDAVGRALNGRSSLDDADTPHSTISNLGAYGVDAFTAIVPFGQTSILSVGTAAERPVVDDGALTVDVTMQATLNVDHRSWDGQHAALVLQKLAAIIAQPALLGALTR